MIDEIEINNKWMEFAILEAKKSEQIGEVPIGALIVFNDVIIASDHNRTISNNDPTAHAELNVIRRASEIIKNYRLIGASLVVTLEPCAMCYGAIIQSRISKLIFGAYDFKTGVCGSCLNLQQTKCFNHRPNIVGGILEKECSQLMSNFFKDRRN